MPRKKLQRFAAIAKFPNVLHFTQKTAKANLRKFLKNSTAVILELGCGRGEHTVQLAQLFPEKKYIGIDYQGERLWYGAAEAKEKKLENVLFLRIKIENLLEYFPPDSIAEIIIPFPDPYPRNRQAKKRLTSPDFLEMYRTLLTTNGTVHLKTDDRDLFEYSQEMAKNHGAHILHSRKNVSFIAKNPLLAIHSYYEKKHRAAEKAIHYLAYRWKNF